MKSKIKIGEMLQVQKTAEALKALEIMGIKEDVIGCRVIVSQASPHGVSFELPWTSPRIERHLGIRFVKCVFGKE